MGPSTVVARYARRFAGVHHVGHSVSSPLGAWLVLAVAAPAGSSDGRDELEDVLGVDSRAAAATLADLLRDPPDVVRAAVAAWGRLGVRLPEGIATGPVPLKAALDEWAREGTRGLIDEFPVADPSGLRLLLASALATRVSWVKPFAVTPAAQLQSPWSAEVGEVLVDDQPNGHLIDTAGAGRVGAHVAVAEGGLVVTSVIGAADVDRAAVLAAAHDIAVAVTQGPPTNTVPLSRLDIGEHGFFSVREVAYPGAKDAVMAVLPAWEAESDHDLMVDPAFGFGSAAKVLAAEGAVDARQVAVARYGRYGFEAAAVTSMAVRGALLTPSTARIVTLRFGHPYAVVAATVGRNRRDPWAGMPVFAAWVETPSDVDAVTTGR